MICLISYGEVSRHRQSTHFPYTTLFRSGNVGETFILTTSIDNLTGTTRNDTFKGVIDDDGTTNNSTAQTGDVVNGGAGNNDTFEDRKSTRLNSSHVKISYAVFCLKKEIR